MLFCCFPSALLIEGAWMLSEITHLVQSIGGEHELLLCQVAVLLPSKTQGLQGCRKPAATLIESK